MCVSVSRSVFQCTGLCVLVSWSVLKCAGLCFSVLVCVKVYWSVLKCTGLCFSALLLDAGGKQVEGQLPFCDLLRVSDERSDNKGRVSTGTKFALEEWLALDNS